VRAPPKVGRRIEQGARGGGVIDAFEEAKPDDPLSLIDRVAMVNVCEEPSTRAPVFIVGDEWRADRMLKVWITLWIK
jgi:hypothetical protein